MRERNANSAGLQRGRARYAFAEDVLPGLGLRILAASPQGNRIGASHLHLLCPMSACFRSLLMNSGQAILGSGEWLALKAQLEEVLAGTLAAAKQGAGG